MKIIIRYDSSWENSFLEGDIQSHHNQNRTYIGSSAKGFDEYKPISVTKNTVLGLMNRLIGEQRRLFQAQADPNYYFRTLEDKISFKEETQITNEIVFLRNINLGSYDRGVLCGVKQLETNDLFSPKFQETFWGLLMYSVPELRDFLLNGTQFVKPFPSCDRFEIGDMINNYIEKDKDFAGNKVKFSAEQEAEFGKILIDLELLTEEEVNKGVRFKTVVYCSLYQMVKIMLAKDPAFKNNLTKNGGLQGIAKRSFTLKDFLKGSGEPKRVVGNPSSYEGYLTIGENKVKTNHFLKKKTGKIVIEINVEKDKASEIKEMIENAAVNSFVVGKKGLAFVEQIII